MPDGWFAEFWFAEFWSCEFCVELELWSAVDGVLCCAPSQKHIIVDRNNEEKILDFIGSPEDLKVLKGLDDHGCAK